MHGGRDGSMSFELAYSETQIQYLLPIQIKTECWWRLFIFDSVQGPPIILRDQIAEGFANVQPSFEYIVKTFHKHSLFQSLACSGLISIKVPKNRCSSTGGVMESPLRPIMPMI